MLQLRHISFRVDKNTRESSLIVDSITTGFVSLPSRNNETYRGNVLFAISVTSGSLHNCAFGICHNNGDAGDVEILSLIPAR